ncbi:MAG: hypothetical protein FWE88_07240 [Phycisphaerae bacterium]|nr:hypothetical protein [Phycisphaerae bacterium]
MIKQLFQRAPVQVYVIKRWRKKTALELHESAFKALKKFIHHGSMQS